LPQVTQGFNALGEFSLIGQKKLSADYSDFRRLKTSNADLPSHPWDVQTHNCKQLNICGLNSRFHLKVALTYSVLTFPRKREPFK